MKYSTNREVAYMANYKINDRLKRIIVSAPLTMIEKDIISIYIDKGYSVKERTASHSRMSEEDIMRWFSIKNDEKGWKEFKKQKEKIIKDKNNNDRKSGYLGAAKWFRETFPEAEKEIKEMKAKENK